MQMSPINSVNLELHIDLIHVVIENYIDLVVGLYAFL